MKKIFLFLGLFFSILFITGCGKYGEKDVVKDFDKKVNKLKSYQIEGKLEIVNNDETIQNALKGKNVVKEIYVNGRIYNIVVK